MVSPPESVPVSRRLRESPLAAGMDSIVNPRSAVDARGVVNTSSGTLRDRCTSSAMASDRDSVRDYKGNTIRLRFVYSDSTEILLHRAMVSRKDGNFLLRAYIRQCNLNNSP